ncbi:hypothetical protein [Devosia marina]|uniref:Uncharacterized protein n=1 Tax=Devosia marina TaxID=2683198 RepID=A0A7X3K3E1_9HYPH|nr:hypothetical protein [Devosia marina]MVS98870.1 hypothetical protein [Devosia marina]
MDELLIRVLTRLLRVHDELGEESFEEAAHRALVAIALAVQFEADRKAGTLKPTTVEGGVVAFPLSTSRRKTKVPDQSS